MKCTSYTLEQRRFRKEIKRDLIETFKILNDLKGIKKGKLFNTNPHHDRKEVIVSSYIRKH